MTIFDVLTLAGGLCLFLFGMNVIGQALERVFDHCSNIAGCILDLQAHNMSIHQNLRYQRKNDAGFKEMFRDYQAKYAL